MRLNILIFFKIIGFSFKDSVRRVGNHTVKVCFFVLVHYLLSRLWYHVFFTIDNANVNNNLVIEGFTYGRLIWYIAFTEIFILSRPDLFREFNQDIKTGRFIFLQTRPYPLSWQIMARYLGAFLAGFLYLLPEGILSALFLAGTAGVIDLYWVFVLLAALPAILLAVVLDFQFFLLLNLCSFFLDDNSTLRWIYHKLLFILGGVMIPLDFFPAGLKFISNNFFVQYIIYRPAMLCLEYSPQLLISTLSGQIIWISFMVLINFWIYRLVRRRQS